MKRRPSNNQHPNPGVVIAVLGIVSFVMLALGTIFGHGGGGDITIGFVRY